MTERTRRRRVKHGSARHDAGRFGKGIVRVDVMGKGLGPITEILRKGMTVVEHAKHIRHLANIPFRDVAIEVFGMSKREACIGQRRSGPVRDVTVE